MITNIILSKHAFMRYAERTDIKAYPLKGNYNIYLVDSKGAITNTIKFNNYTNTTNNIPHVINTSLKCSTCKQLYLSDLMTGYDTCPKCRIKALIQMEVIPNDQ